MTATAEAVRRVLASWFAIEVLTPPPARNGWQELAAEKGGQQRNKATTRPDGPEYWKTPADDDPTPWPIRATEAGADRNDCDARASEPDELVPWHSVVLGALPAQRSFERLDAAFSDRADEDEVQRQTQGNLVAASLVLDRHGIVVSSSIAIASFAWGLGQALRDGPSARLALWGERERELKSQLGNVLAPTGPDGAFRSLTWRDLRSASCALADELGLPTDLWQVTPCSIQTVSKDPPRADLLCSFYLPDLGRVARGVDTLPPAAAAYLGLSPPHEPWDALTDRARLSELLHPQLFPLGRWPGPGLHPLTLLQQAAVNAIVRDLDRAGLAAVNGPPGTGKTTLLRDVVAHVVVSRAEALSKLEDPARDLSKLDLMDFAAVVASTNNAAVENISLDLPIRAKALDESFWSGRGLDYFGRTANAVLKMPSDAADRDRAWGVLAGRLGNAANRRSFFEAFWWDHDWGLHDWLDAVAWPNHQTRPGGKLAQLERPPRYPEAAMSWRAARDNFRRAIARCERLREELAKMSDAARRLTEVESRLPSAETRLLTAEAELASAKEASAAARGHCDKQRADEAAELAKLEALSSSAPSFLARWFRTRTWRAHQADIRRFVVALEEAQATSKAATARLDSASAEESRCMKERDAARQQRDRLHESVAELRASLQRCERDAGGACPPPGFWSQPDHALQRTSPWNGGEFRDARDALFEAAIRLHKALVVFAAKPVKSALHNVARGVVGGPGAPRPSAADWGIFFLVVPVVSTTFASIGRMFEQFGPGEIGWMLIDEAGQAAPQAAMGAIWRARRAVAIGDPLQIEPVATTPERTTRLVFEQNGAEAQGWAAPGQSAQTLADRASGIQGRFRVHREGGKEERITGIPLLVHRRCERPMFELSNDIAYANRMVFATPEGPSPIREVLGSSAWIDVDAPSSDKWVEAEGELIAGAIAALCRALDAAPDMYVVCPFRMPATRLKTLLEARSDVLPGYSSARKKEWIGKRVGTVHTFQGKEAEAVVLMLGAGRGAKAGSRSWAGEKPNLLNVAATRAKRVLYVVGNRAEWEKAGVFSVAARRLETRSARDWLPAQPVALAPS